MSRRGSLLAAGLRSGARARPRGFTLVELLVVIGIVAVLISILLPVVGRAKRQAYATQCASNLRQFATAFSQYANDFGGTAVPMRLPEDDDAVADIGNGKHYRPRWYDLLGARMKLWAFSRPPTSDTDTDKRIDNKAFLCPGEPEWDNARNAPYGYNFQFLGNVRGKAGGGYVNFPVRLSRITKAADTVMAADSMGTAAGKARTSRTGYRRDGVKDLFAVGNHSYTIDPPRLTARSDYSEDNARSPADRSAPDPRHNGKANVAFCDGHVELLALQDLGYVVNANGSVAATDPRAHNRRFSGRGADDDPPPVQ
jgi:prepilin-type processing-associated H-X9-DG protein/prepilin-type N-terminal cleavage/methylation domain-containing protein